jgi:hypothetical protein
MSETPQHLAERLRDEGQKTEEFFQSLAPEELEKTLYSDGNCWKVRQLLAHFVATEVAIGVLIENILAGGSGAPENFDINAYNERKVMQLHNLSPRELQEQFTQRRQASVRLVQGMDLEDLQKIGRHPFLGVTTVEEIVKLLYRHIQIHQRDVRRLGKTSQTA